MESRKIVLMNLLHGNNRDTDIENKLTDLSWGLGRKEGMGCREREICELISPYVK